MARTSTCVQAAAVSTTAWADGWLYLWIIGATLRTRLRPRHVPANKLVSDCGALSGIFCIRLRPRLHENIGTRVRSWLRFQSAKLWEARTQSNGNDDDLLPRADRASLLSPCDAFCAGQAVAPSCAGGPQLPLARAQNPWPRPAAQTEPTSSTNPWRGSLAPWEPRACDPTGAPLAAANRVRQGEWRAVCTTDTQRCEGRFVSHN